MPFSHPLQKRVWWENVCCWLIFFINMMCLLSNPNTPVDMAHIPEGRKWAEFAEEGAAVKNKAKKKRIC